MLTTLAIAGYRSLRDLIVPLGWLNVITGPNGSGKSNVYRALRLLAETSRGGVIPSLAREEAVCNPRCGPGRSAFRAPCWPANRRWRARAATSR